MTARIVGREGTRRARSPYTLLTLALLAACGDGAVSGGSGGVVAPDAGAAATGGSRGSSGGGSAGASATSNAGGARPVDDGSVAGGSTGSSGTTGTGGSTGPVGGDGAADSGRDAAAPRATADSGAGAGDGGPPVPSAGCAKMAGRPANGEVAVANDHIYDFPTTYDGKNPMPFLIGLHAAGNPNTQIEGLSNGTRLSTNFVRAFPKSAGTAWVYATDAPKITAVYDDVLANYCVDTSRVFLTGHSSGAQMAVQMLCNGDTRFKAVAPVAASKYCNRVTPISVMYIQGMMDAMRGNGNGADVVAVFTASNGCSATTVPDPAVPACTSTFDRMTVAPGCVIYQGCSQPTIWCSHNDNGYNATDGHQHGWPCFASNAMADFFLGP